MLRQPRKRERCPMTCGGSPDHRALSWFPCSRRSLPAFLLPHPGDSIHADTRVGVHQPPSRGDAEKLHVEEFTKSPAPALERQRSGRVQERQRSRCPRAKARPGASRRPFAPATDTLFSSRRARRAGHPSERPYCRWRGNPPGKPEGISPQKSRVLPLKRLPVPCVLLVEPGIAARPKTTTHPRWPTKRRHSR